MLGEGRIVAEFRCPCSDVEAPARTSFWVELVGVPGFPPVLYGVCARCRDKWVGVAKGNVGDYKVKRWFGATFVAFGNVTCVLKIFPATVSFIILESVL